MSMFIDKAKIFVKSGNGGHGAVSFRRENMCLLEGQTEEMAVERRRCYGSRS